MVKIARTSPRNTPAQTGFAVRRIQDICGLILFFVGAGSLLCLALPQQAFVPRHVDEILRLLAGMGAYAVPLLLMFAGTMFLIGFERLSFSEASCGTVLLFLDFLAFRHLRLLQHLEGLKLPPRDLPAQILALVPQAGGWLGWLFGTALNGLLGITLSYLALLLAFLIGIVLIVDQPFVEILRRIHAQGRSGAQAAAQFRELVTDGRREEKEKRRKGEEETGEQGTGNREQGTAGTQSAIGNRQSAIASPSTSSEDRATRAARVAERALLPGGRNATPPHGVREDAETHPAVASKTPNLFNLTRLWRGEKTDDERGRGGEEETGRRGEDEGTGNREQGTEGNAPAREAGVATPKPKPRKNNADAPDGETQSAIDNRQSTIASPPLPLPPTEFSLPPLDAAGAGSARRHQTRAGRTYR